MWYRVLCVEEKCLCGMNFYPCVINSNPFIFIYSAKILRKNFRILDKKNIPQNNAPIRVLVKTRIYYLNEF